MIKYQLTLRQTQFLQLLENLQQRKIYYHGWSDHIQNVLNKGYCNEKEIKIVRNARLDYINYRGKRYIPSEMKNLGNTKTNNTTRNDKI